LFLTLLALIAGVSVQLAPAEARGRSPDASEINCRGPFSEENSTAEASLSPRVLILACPAGGSMIPREAAAIRIPTVWLRVDRARE
jgi:hypothetical protein